MCSVYNPVGISYECQITLVVDWDDNVHVRVCNCLIDKDVGR